MRALVTKLSVALTIAIAFGATMYTTNGCGGTGSPTSPTVPFADVHGTVTDAATGKPIVNASVSGAQASVSITVSSLADGTYFLGGLQAGDIKVTVKATGYQTFTTTVTATPGSNTLNVPLHAQ